MTYINHSLIRCRGLENTYYIKALNIFLLFYFFIFVVLLFLKCDNTVRNATKILQKNEKKRLTEYRINCSRIQINK